ncbi:MAG: Flp pilus assembly complex ATPase component TadA [Planctomycetes bacterium]|nr:Flp pilus assembly complex ATPase component TadA [Planctomycetota bacterium]
MEDTRLGAILLETRLVPEKRLRQCLEIQALTGGSRPLGQILVEQGVITPRALADLLRIQEARRRVQHEVTAPQATTNAPNLLTAAIDTGANDLVLGEGRPPMVRIGGSLRRLTNDPTSGPEIWDFVRTQLGHDALERIAQRGALTRALPKATPARGRVTAFRHLDGLGVAVRLHPLELRTPADCGLDASLVEVMRGGRGLVLIAGEHGSGVTETFASMLHEASAAPGRSVHVLDRCFEYPTSRAGSMVTRRAIGTHTRRLDDALRAALREEPDAMFVGELDGPSVQLVLHAAEHAGLVVACVRARSATEAILRILSLCPPHEQDRARAVLAATCVAILGVQVVPIADASGLVVATEFLRFDDTVRDVVRSGAVRRIGSLLRVESAACGHSMDVALLRLVGEGRVKVEDAFPHATDKGWFLDAASECAGAKP